ncbi:class I SAM-dependent methyltransferase [Desulfofalx alkaliphila]|uniref:class I SAM-dependent methyltransferase n=1 Tax=Desulfofalx alkaliphila TaxID=105483 RepID=UPI0004E16DD3|nr:class I SAM-dependent methyltransferase [Desulfofalx alkaliphila]
MPADKCWLCKATALPIAEGRPAYYQCPSCDLIFIDQNYILSQDEEKERYLFHDNSLDNKGYVSMFKSFIDKAVTPYAGGVKKGLDFGCGPGPVLSKLLSDRGIEMEHYDPYFYNNVKFDGKEYHLITATEVFEHLRRPDQVLHFLKKHLAPEGILAVMTLFHGNSDFTSWWYKLDPTHICFYSHKTFHWIAEHYNFSILYLDSKNICVLQNSC